MGREHEVSLEVDEAPAVDLDLDEMEVLKRYHGMFNTFRAKGVLKEISGGRLTSKDRVQYSIIDFSVCHALLGADYIGTLQLAMQYTVLQAALILTISMPLYISPPGFSSDAIAHAFSGVIGGAALSQLSCIIGTTILSALWNRPYSPMDRMIARVESQHLFVLTTLVNYLSQVLTMAAMFIAGFDRAYLDGYVQLYAIVVVFGIFTLFVIILAKGDKYQDERTLAFYNKYCEDSGRLWPKYIKMIEEDLAEGKKK